MTFTSTQNCDSVVQVTLGFYAAISIELTALPTCPGESEGSISGMLSGGSGNYSWLWSNGATTATINNLAEGMYTVTISDSNGCTAEGSAIVEKFEIEPVFELSDPTCNDTATGGIVVTNAEAGWQFALNDDPFQSEPFFNGLEAGQYMITIIDENGCEIERTLVLQAPPAIEISGLPSEIELFVDESYNFAAVVSGLGPYEYSWSPTTGLTCPGMSTLNCLNPSVSGITEETTYTLTVSIPGNESCFAIDSITIIPKIQCDGTYALPNAFTPNGDGQNDVFKLLHQDNGIRISSFVVFDRWGEKVYEGEGDSAGWNGTYNGKALPMDSYIYRVQLVCPDGVDVRELVGDVSLVR
jgi:gliding motility-associated-like protein